MKKMLCAILTLMLVFTCSLALAEGTLRVGMECNYAPFNWTQDKESEYSVPLASGGYADGYDVQIARLIAEGLDMELEIVKTEWDGLIMGVNSGITDAIIAGMSPTAERKMSIEFTDNYYTSELVLVVKKDGKFAQAQTLEDFAGACVTGQINTVHYSVIDQIAGVNKAMAMDTFPQMIVALDSGVIDAYVAERPGAVADTTANPGLTYISFAEGAGFEVSDDDKSVAVGVKIGSELTEKINAILAGIDQAQREQIMLEATARQPLLSLD